MTTIDNKIIYWRNQLLDLGKRNRLINCPVPRQSGRISHALIAINRPNANTLWEQFTENNKSLIFPQLEVNQVSRLYSGENCDSNDGSITNQSIIETQKTLRNLMQKSRVFTEEKGLNALYLTFGYLNWKDKKDDNLRSPLLLVPVQLSQKDLFSPFALSRHDDEIMTNYVLNHRLYDEYKIVMPDYTDEINFHDYIENVRKICAKMKWAVTLETELSLFSFLKINMYNDLGNNADKIKSHSIIRAIAGETKSINGARINAGYTNTAGFDHDVVDPQTVYCVVDADSSQQDAILLAKRGVSFTLQGPPGTGKSQTITNIIAELLSNGKKILFVSEKMAALEVVHKRLIMAGLSGFCLTLHSHNAKRREVLDQLEVSLKLTQSQAVLDSSAFGKLAQLKQQRKQLNDYSQELHATVEPIGETIYGINGKIAALNDIPNISFSPQSPETLTPSDIVEQKNLLGDLSRIVEQSGYQTANPWLGCTLTHITNQFRQQFSIESINTLNVIDDVISSQSNGTENFSAAKLSYDDYKNCANLVANKNQLDIGREKIKQKYTERIFDINGEDFLARCRTQYRSIFRILNSKFRVDRNYILGSQKIIEKMALADMTALAENLYNIQSIEREIEHLSALLIDKNSNFPIKIVAELFERLAVPICWFTALFEQQQLILSKPLEEIRYQIQRCVDNFSDLEYYIDYREVLKKSSQLGIEEFILQVSRTKLPAEMIIPAFEKCLYCALHDVILPHYDAIREFRRAKQDDRILSFKEFDKSHIEISKAALITKLISNLPTLNTFTSEHDEIGTLKRELAKQRKLMPTRKLFVSLPHLIPVLKPCMMMSPLSVSTYLGGGNYEFDVVIFDEASQVLTEDAVGALFRAKQAIIAGDSKQLPPTDFFRNATSVYDDDKCDEDEEINDTGAYESLLDEASLLPSQTLLWHYRSRHEHLIAFSNVKIYRNSLVTFPSPVENAENIGVQYIHVPSGIYDRGGRKGNRMEAEKVAGLAFEHLRKNPERSLGIIAFGEVQQSAILDAILQMRKENPSFEPFFKDDLDEAIFIKNLETVQGDERDTIIFSIGYAPDIAGKFIMNFGPLSRNGGERRLNVAITRARYNVKLVGSILPPDIDIERVSCEGPKLLRSYIDFAINGASTILGTLTDDKAIVFNSPFEKVIYDFIIEHGYDVTTQVGCSGYRIDIAVRHPKFSGRFAIGIECDGTTYHSARTARERDRLRQTVLEGMGWKLYRIWSTDWIKDPKNEGKKLLLVIEEAITHYCETITSETPKAGSAAYFDVSDRIIHTEELPRPGFFGYTADEIPLNDFENMMLKIISQSFGIDKDGLFKTTALCYGWQRRGEVIKDRLEKAYNQLLRSKKIIEVNRRVVKAPF